LEEVKAAIDGLEATKDLGRHIETVWCLRVWGKYLFSGSDDKTVKVWNLETLEEVTTLTGHSDTVYCLQVWGKYLFSGSNDKTVKVWNLETLQEVTTLAGHTDIVRCLQVWGQYLFSGSSDKTVRVWNLETLQEVTTLKGHTSAVWCLQVWGKYLFSGSDDKTVKVWNLETLQEVTTLTGHTSAVWCLQVWGKYLFSGSNDKTVRVTKLYSEYKDSPGLAIEISEIRNIVDSKSSQYNRTMNQLRINSQNINLLHVLAYQGKDQLLKIALEQGCQFLKSAKGNTPLTVSLEAGNKKCTEVILKYISELEDCPRKSFIFSLISEDIPRLLEENFSQATSICESATSNAVRPIKTSKLPHYFKDQVPFNAYIEKTGEYKNVKAGTTQFKFNSEEGSHESLRLLNAFLDTERLDCFLSDFVQALADYKFLKFRPAIMTIGLLNLASVALIMGMAFSTETTTRQAFTGFFLLLNFFSTVFELLQINSGEYFKSLKNYLDIARIVLGYVWGVLSLTSEFENLNSPNYLTLITSFLFWLEGINAFKVIESTRYYIWLIQEVIRDTASFLLILVYFILAYCGLTGITLNSTLPDTLATSYKLLLGDFDDSDFDNIQWILFVLGSVLNLIVMLNLLIAIISDNFPKSGVRHCHQATVDSGDRKLHVLEEKPRTRNIPPLCAGIRRRRTRRRVGKQSQEAL